MKESTRVLLALGGAVAGGLIIAATKSDPLIHAADSIAPVGALWVNAIRMTVIPLVVSLLITGIASASDVKAIGRLGGRTIVVFLSLLIGTAALVMPFAPSLFALLPSGARPPMPAGAVEAAGQLAASGTQTLGSWLTSLIPTNPIAAAANTQLVPLVLFTMLFALATVRSAPATRASIVGFFTAIGDTMLVIVRWVVLAAPIGIFALVLPLATHAGSALVGGIGFYIAAYSIACIVFSLLLYPVVAVFVRVPIGRLRGRPCRRSSLRSVPAHPLRRSPRSSRARTSDLACPNR